jgi:hypothetical protein
MRSFGFQENYRSDDVRQATIIQRNDIRWKLPTSQPIQRAHQRWLPAAGSARVAQVNSANTVTKMANQCMSIET